MNSGLYAACAGLVARTQTLDLIANNLANTTTAGYKSQQPMFQAVVAGAAGRNDLERAVNNFGVLGGSRLDLAPGTAERTGSDFDLAIDGNGFFAVQTAAGVRYTRQGRFELSSTRQLVTPAGVPVLGEDGPLRIPQGTMTVSGDGNVSVDGATVGRLRLVDFPAGTSLEAAGNGYLTADQPAQPAKSAVVRQGVLEASNVDAVGAAVSLITVQRHAELLQRALSIFHNDFNRIASQDLPRIS